MSLDAAALGKRLNLLVQDVIDAERRAEAGDEARCPALVEGARRDHAAILRMLDDHPDLASPAMRRMATALGTVIEQLERRAFAGKRDGSGRFDRVSDAGP